MKKGFKSFIIKIASLIAVAVTVSTVVVERALPDRFYVPASAELDLGTPLFGVRSAGKGISGEDECEYAIISLLGIPIKTVTLDRSDERRLAVCGTPFGVKMFTDGAVVVGIGSVNTENGPVRPAREAGIEEGDVVLSVDGRRVRRNSDIAGAVNDAGGQPVEVVITRGEEELTVTLTPALGRDDGRYRAGLWVRDSSAGIGMMTFIDPETGTFGALGHAVTDVDTAQIMPLYEGELVAVDIDGCTLSTSAGTGELFGSFRNNVPLGILTVNSETGLFGKALTDAEEYTLLPVAYRQQVCTGHCSILTTIEGDEPRYYDAKILKIDISSRSDVKNMVVEITDERLIEKTGGIVQGMSGSPIIQDGKIVGAVTHVFIGNATRGYAIFIENMLETADDSIDGAA